MTDIRADWIAVEWSATPRAWAMGEAILAETSGPVSETFSEGLIRLIEPWLRAGERLPVIVSGAANPADARAVPATPLAGPLPTLAIDDGRVHLRLVSGLRQQKPFIDLTTGAETEIAGFLTNAPQFDGVLCLPGATTTWAHLSAGEVVSFQSFLTGGVAEAMRCQLGLSGGGINEAAFAEGVEDARSRPERVTSHLSALRAQLALRELAPADAQARLKGLMIGQELAAARPYWLGQQVSVAGAPDAQLYVAALRLQGADVTAEPEAPLALAGLIRAHSLMTKGSA